MSEKIGADDFAVAGAAAPDFARLPREALENLFTTDPDPLHLAQDFRDGQLSYGWTLARISPDEARPRTKLGVITSDRRVYVGERRSTHPVARLHKIAGPASAPAELVVLARSDAVRGEAAWGRCYCEGASEPTAPLLNVITDALRRRVVFPDARAARVVALWTLGTYVYTVFDAFPYLWVRSPTKRCGKTWLLDTLAALAFGAPHRLARPTEAVLVRLPSHTRAPQLIDEADNLNGKDEVWAALVGVLNHGYTRGGVVPRVHRDTGEVELFDVYCPKAIAGLKQLADTLEDRSIIVTLQRKNRSEGVMRKKELLGLAAPLRARARVWALEHAPKLATLAEQPLVAELLRDLDDRFANLLEPLLVVALLADGETDGQAAAEDLLGFCRGLAGTRAASEQDATTAKLVAALLGLVGSREACRLKPSDLFTRVKAWDGLEWISSPKALATLLAPLEISAKSVRFEDGSRGRGYELDRAGLEGLAERYPVSDEPAASL